MVEPTSVISVPSEIRSVLIPLQRVQLLLPNAAVAEVIDYQTPVSIDNAPEWVMGTIGWRQRSLTVVRFEPLLGQVIEEIGVRSKIIVCHSLNPAARRPFLGLVAAGIPRLVRVREDSLQEHELSDDLQDAPVHTRVLVDGVDAMIPDLGALEQRLALQL